MVRSGFIVVVSGGSVPIGLHAAPESRWLLFRVVRVFRGEACAIERGALLTRRGVWSEFLTNPARGRLFWVFFLSDLFSLT